jgi:hypothetical protein
VFGVQKIVNLACGSFYALGAYFGVTFIVYATELGLSAWFILPGLILAGLALGAIGPQPGERLGDGAGIDRSGHYPAGYRASSVCRPCGQMTPAMSAV